MRSDWKCGDDSVVYEGHLMDKKPTRKLCDRCGKTILTVLKKETVEVPVLNETVTVSFMAHHCPECGAILCERNFDEVMMELVEEAYKRKTGRPMTGGS